LNAAEAGQPAPLSVLIQVPQLITAYFEDRPDPTVGAQRVVFGTSGHRGCALDVSFNEWHVLAMAQAVCDHRRAAGIDGPLFLGMDTHALSVPACANAVEVFAANGVELMLAALSESEDEYTPTPAVSHAILGHNRGRDLTGGSGVADGIVITPSHNPPRDGGFKYNPPHGGPAGQGVTAWIEAAANRHLETKLANVKRMPHAAALRAATTHRHDYRSAYVADLGNVIDMDAIRHAKLRVGVDPLGGAGVHYWAAIAERWRIDLTVISDVVDPTFRFMTLDWDGKIRMDPSSKFAMQSLIALKDDFDIAFACDTDHDRHGIVTPSAGLLPPNHYLCVAIDYLFRYRPQWGAQTAVGKSVVTTQLIDRVAARLGRPLLDMPVGFKWFAAGLLNGSLGFAGEESAGASFLRRDGSVWTTDKDGIAAALLAAEITAVMQRDPGTLYDQMTEQLGKPHARRVEAAATAQQRSSLAAFSATQVTAVELAGEKIESVITRAPGNNEWIGGVKVGTANGWFAARPSGTESIYKIYAESFQSEQHLQRLLQEAQAIVDAAIAPGLAS
jgi:phosphoglucomutase